MALVRRVTQDGMNAISDAYGSIFLGDDAGKSVRIVLVLKPFLNRKGRNTSSLNLGMTFIEINGRAFVNTVTPLSEADKAGVRPRDAIQYAAVASRDWDSDMTLENADDLISRHALLSESKGMRITYNELRRVLAEGMDSTQPAFLSPSTRGGGSQGASPWSVTGPPIPATINVCSSSDDKDYLRPSSPFRGESPRPVVFVFRRTRQRSSPYFSILPSFRIDDECDFASSLVKRLAPTADMDSPIPDVWDEFVHDGTDWLLGSGSILPPKNGSPPSRMDEPEGNEMSIPLDEFERERSKKLASLRSRMAAEALAVDRTDDVEAATIRGMIQKAVGLAFVRASKVVLGVSLHGGSGIVIARLSDGTWSAPSAIGTWGLGLGLQFGLEVADYIFILQTQESLEHFMRGGSFTVGGNVGAAVAGMGREAYGAASVGGLCGSEATIKEDEYNDQSSRDDQQMKPGVGIAPIVAYAKSQGLYIGVSLEGSRIFTRDDINCRTYKFTSGKNVSAYDILSGKVPTPPEAEDLYAALHSVEFTHEMSCLPRPPEVLRKDSPNSWYFDRNTLGQMEDASPKRASGRESPFTFLSNMSEDDAEECTIFETSVKKFLYGGVSVQRLIPNSESRSGRTRRERRTLWLMLPEVGSLRLGFVSKLSDEEGAVSNKSSTQRVRRDETDSRLMDTDLGTVASEEVTLDSALLDKDNASTLGQIRTGNVELSVKHSVALTDVTLLSHDPPVAIKFKPDDQTEHLRVISIKDVSGTNLLFLANNFREAELLLCGLKLLLERETTRLGVRGGMPLASFGGRSPLAGAMSPAAARGFKDSLPQSSYSRRRKGRSFSGSSKPSGYSSSEVEEPDESVGDVSSPNANSVPEGWRSWGRVPGRNYMRGQAASHDASGNADEGVPKYVHGQLLVRDICKNVRLPLPLPLCRVLLLDSSSPVITKWEQDRGDSGFEKTPWTFPPATPREKEHYQSEHQLIASGSMCGAHRTTSYERPRNGSLVRLSETQIVDSDDSEKLSFTVSERMPRRGFSIKVRILLRSYTDASCEATILGEIRPVGKNMSNQAAVHKAFLLVVDELKLRYGVDGVGLMGGFLSVVESMQKESKADQQRDSDTGNSSLTRPFRRTGPTLSEEKKENDVLPKATSSNESSGLVSFEDILKKNRIPNDSPEKGFQSDRPSTPSIHLQAPDPDLGKRVRARKREITNDVFENLDEDSKREPVMIEVKPLPKIRLSLMPSPREEDELEEEEEDEHNKSHGRGTGKKKKKSSRSSGSGWRKSSRTKK